MSKSMFCFSFTTIAHVYLDWNRPIKKRQTDTFIIAIKNIKLQFGGTHRNRKFVDSTRRNRSADPPEKIFIYARTSSEKGE